MKVESFSNYASINTTQSKAVSIPSLSLRCKQIACAILALAFTAEASDTRKTMTLDTSQFSLQTLAISFLVAAFGGLALARCRTKSKEMQAQLQSRSQQSEGLESELGNRIRLVQSNSSDRFNAKNVFCRDNGDFVDDLPEILACYDNSELMAMLAFAKRTKIQGKTLEDKYWEYMRPRAFPWNKEIFQASENIEMDPKAAHMFKLINSRALRDPWIKMLHPEHLFQIYLALTNKIDKQDKGNDPDIQDKGNDPDIGEVKLNRKLNAFLYGFIPEEQKCHCEPSQVVVPTSSQPARVVGQSRSLVVAS